VSGQDGRQPDEWTRYDARTFVAPGFGARVGGALFDGFLGLCLFGLLRTFTPSEAALAVSQFAGLVYYVAMTAVSGQTVGKMVANTRLVSFTGGPLELRQVVMCWLAYNAIPIFLGYTSFRALAGFWALFVIIPILQGPLHRGAHDRFANTIVIATRPRIPRDAR
jgi:uncharacterized RDD family membrane protein YckC